MLESLWHPGKQRGGTIQPWSFAMNARCVPDGPAISGSYISSRVPLYVPIGRATHAAVPTIPPSDLSLTHARFGDSRELEYIIMYRMLVFMLPLAAFPDAVFSSRSFIAVSDIPFCYILHPL